MRAGAINLCDNKAEHIAGPLVPSGVVSSYLLVLRIRFRGGGGCASDSEGWGGAAEKLDVDMSLALRRHVFMRIECKSRDAF